MPKEFDLGQRIQALTLHSEGYPRSAISKKTGYTPGGLGYLIKAAKKRGYKPGSGPILRHYVDNEPGRGRPPISGDRKHKVLEILNSDPDSRKLSTQKLAEKFNAQAEDDRTISRRTVLRLLDSEGYKRVHGVWQQSKKTAQ
ncbi:hypothetical protein F5Y14DRAFT_395383 [Nemania sp. NC0429]|nr:hypothetical protein F5Y14DRAFT_395383 [Nemania sp. NC0429]